MQINIDSGPGRCRVLAKKAQKWIKRGRRIRIQKRRHKPGCADLTDGNVLPFIPGVTETGFPIPSLEIIAKFSHLALQADVKKSIPVGELLTSGTGIVNTTKPNSRSHRDKRTVRANPVGVPNRKRVKRIRDWHTDASGSATNPYRRPRLLKHIGDKRHSCERCIEIRSDIFEVCKHR